MHVTRIGLDIAKSVWVEAIRQGRGDNIAAVALAAEYARIVGAPLARGQEYQGATGAHLITATREVKAENQVGQLTTGGKADEVMDYRSDRCRPNPIALQVQSETVARIGSLQAYLRQGWSNTAHTEAGYRHAVRSLLPILLITLAPLGASI